VDNRKAQERRSPAGFTDRKTKVLFVLRMIGFGGTERQVVELCAAINKQRFDVTVVLFFHTEGYWEDLRKTGVRIEVLSTKASYKKEVFVKLARFLRGESFDIIHTFLPIPNFVGGLVAALNTKAFVIASIRNANPFSWRDPFCLMDLLAFHLFAKKIVANSQTGAEYCRQRYHVAAEKVAVIPNGRNFFEYEGLVPLVSLKKELGINDEKVITTIGRISRQKGQKYLVAAVREIVFQYHQKVILLIVGKREEAYDELQKDIKSQGMEGKVKFLGIRRDISAILSITDFFVLPSLWEGMANVLLEAMAARVPVVATNIPANQEILKHENTGLLVPPQDALAIQEMILRLLGDVDLCKNLTGRAYQFVRENYSLEQLAVRHEKLYEDCLSALA
jgi:glycosyltransferase involved in cell wall biosynthesis